MWGEEVIVFFFGRVNSGPFTGPCQSSFSDRWEEGAPLLVDSSQAFSCLVASPLSFEKVFLDRRWFRPAFLAEDSFSSSGPSSSTPLHSF